MDPLTLRDYLVDQKKKKRRKCVKTSISLLKQLDE